MVQFVAITTSLTPGFTLLFSVLGKICLAVLGFTAVFALVGLLLGLFLLVVCRLPADASK